MHKFLLIPAILSLLLSMAGCDMSGLRSQSQGSSSNSGQQSSPWPGSGPLVVNLGQLTVESKVGKIPLGDKAQKSWRNEFKKDSSFKLSRNSGNDVCTIKVTGFFQDFGTPKAKVTYIAHINHPKSGYSSAVRETYKTKESSDAGGADFAKKIKKELKRSR